jgi:hypothetical protein
LAAPVFGVRHFVLLRGIGTLFVDQLESKGNTITPVFSFSCRVHQSSMISSNRPALILRIKISVPARCRQTLERAESGWRHDQSAGPERYRSCSRINKARREVLQAYLLLPVAGKDCPVTRFNQTANSNSVTEDIILSAALVPNT